MNEKYDQGESAVAVIDVPRFYQALGELVEHTPETDRAGLYGDLVSIGSALEGRGYEVGELKSAYEAMASQYGSGLEEEPELAGRIEPSDLEMAVAA
jgi:hypothetical protein